MSISPISVTRDVSKFSGWLNAFASCRVKRGPYDAGLRGAAWKAGRMVGGAVAAHVACKGGLDWSLWAQDTRAKCTLSMERMSVTRDVSKLSGWLNTFARCRVRKESTRCGAGCGPGGGEVGGAATAHAACKGRLDWSLWAQGTGGVHVEHGVHGRDAGRVEAQRLVERLCFLPSRKGAYHVGRGRAGGGERGGAAVAHAACKGGSTGVCGQGMGGVHLEHFLHGRDAGRVPAQQRLVERLRFLPSRKEGDTVRGKVRGEVRAGSLEGGGVQRRKQRARQGPNG